jgi:urease accessory protein
MAALTARRAGALPEAPLPSRQALSSPSERRGEAKLVLSGESGTTRILDLYQKQPLRLLFPGLPGDTVIEAALACISGGIVAGDELSVSVDVHDGAKASVIGQAAEKIYRSTGADSRIDNSLSVGDDCWLEWLPQETIIFDQARFRRTTTVRKAKSGRLLAGEILVFGRTARKERLRRGLIHDAWEIYDESGRLAWKDALHLGGDLRAVISHPAAFDGADAYGNVLYCAQDSRNLLEVARAVAERNSGAQLRVGATMVRNLLRVQFVGNALSLRNAFAEIWMAIRHANGFSPSMPRLWSI